ncbi:hypothetical protein JNUCC0626_50485 (plasmid) [Lentzea sp. JNUCC 0626]|uniref:hypothetical protein n=1 Tax=Lentzea sp. JNUCC 0626 TaxID=3367513 RepID=UPI0037499030
MFTFDGVVLRSEPITLAQLYCGCIKTYAGHDVQVNALALCPEPDTCPGIAEQREMYPSCFSLAAATAVASLVRAHAVS